MKRWFAGCCILCLSLSLAACGGQAVRGGASLREECPAVSREESVEPAEPAVEPALHGFTAAGFDKDGPGDLGYQVSLTAEEQALLPGLLRVEEWREPEELPEYGLTVCLSLQNFAEDYTLTVWDGGDLGALILVMGRDASSRQVFQAPPEVVTDAREFALALRGRLPAH